MHTDRAIDLIATFVIPNRRDRYLRLLQSARGRGKLRQGLAHFKDLDPRYAAKLSGDQDASAIAATLFAKGAPPTCYALSEASRIDDRELSLETALMEVVGRGMGTFLSCIAGQLAYFEGEEPNERYILARDARAT
jgi:hypothetical protein